MLCVLHLSSSGVLIERVDRGPKDHSSAQPFSLRPRSVGAMMCADAVQKPLVILLLTISEVVHGRSLTCTSRDQVSLAHLRPWSQLAFAGPERRHARRGATSRRSARDDRRVGASAELGHL